jgi:hypothetical protein
VQAEYRPGGLLKTTQEYAVTSQFHSTLAKSEPQSPWNVLIVNFFFKFESHQKNRDSLNFSDELKDLNVLDTTLCKLNLKIREHFL